MDQATAGSSGSERQLHTSRPTQAFVSMTRTAALARGITVAALRLALVLSPDGLGSAGERIVRRFPLFSSELPYVVVSAPHLRLHAGAYAR